MATKKEKMYMGNRLSGLKLRAALKYNIAPERCHVGHLALQAMLERPNDLNQIDVATDERETNGSVALRTCRLASAMQNYGLKPGDVVVIIGPNHLDLTIPYYACHFNGHSMCTIDQSIIAEDLNELFSSVNVKMVFCEESHVDIVNFALDKNRLEAPVIAFDKGYVQINKFIEEHKGTEINYRPGEFDQRKTIAWLMMTSGTTGVPKVAMIPYETLLTGIYSWWSQYTDRIYVVFAMGTIQWMSSLHFFIAAPLVMFTRLQSSETLTPQKLIAHINKYRPNATAWMPHMLEKFVEAAGDYCDLSSFTYITIGGAAVEKPLLDTFRKKCSARLYLIYGMTELLVPVFEYNDDVPFGSAGKPLSKFQYRLVADEDTILDNDNNRTGELWIKGDEFFVGYLNRLEETEKVITKDGWVRTGDIFYRDENDYYYFVERKRLLIKYIGKFISPLPLEDAIKQHPGVSEVCVVALEHPTLMELAVGAIVRRPGHNVEADEIFDLLNKSLPAHKQLHGGLIFLDALPTTPSGKIHRAKIKEIAFRTPRIMPKAQQ